MPRDDGPFKVLEKINDNAYKLELPTDFGVSPTFNIADLKPYLGEDDELSSRTTSFQEGEDDEDINTIVTPTVVVLSLTVEWGVGMERQDPSYGVVVHTSVLRVQALLGGSNSPTSRSPEAVDWFMCI